LYLFQFFCICLCFPFFFLHFCQSLTICVLLHFLFRFSIYIVSSHINNFRSSFTFFLSFPFCSPYSMSLSKLSTFICIFLPVSRLSLSLFSCLPSRLCMPKCYPLTWFLLTALATLLCLS
jgi:hypothetical protein